MGRRNSFPPHPKGSRGDSRISQELSGPTSVRTKRREGPLLSRALLGKTSSLHPARAPQPPRTLTVSSGCPTNTRHMPPKPPASRFLSRLMGFTSSAVVDPSVTVACGFPLRLRSTTPAAAPAPPEAFHPLSGGRGLSPGAGREEGLDGLPALASAQRRCFRP